MKWIKLDENNTSIKEEKEKIEGITILGIDLNSSIMNEINSCSSLKELSIKNCFIESNNIQGENIECIYLENSLLTDLDVINRCNNINTLYLKNMKKIYLKEIYALKQLKTLCISNTPVEDQEYLIELDKIEKLDISHSSITDITPLIHNQTLKILMMDEIQYKNNKDYLKEFTNVLIVDENGDKYE